MTRFRPLLIAAVLLLAVAPFSVSALALTVYPAELTIEPGSPGYYVVDNKSNRAMAVVVAAYDWNPDEVGGEENPETEQLVVYPSQFILKGHQQRKVKVSPRFRAGDTERPFRVVIRELPVRLEEKEETSGLYMTVAYRTACYVTPTRAKSKLTLEQAALDQDKLEVVVLNKGTAHQHLHGNQLEITDEQGRKHTIESAAVTSVMEKENVHAGHRRRFTIQLPDQLTTKPTLLTWTFDKNGRPHKETTQILAR